jgi:Na+(H+)/acetate symporter ActP
MIVFLASFIGLLLIGAPIAVAIGAGAAAGCLNLGYPFMVVGQKMVTGIDSYLLIAVPLFIFAGNLMNVGKITTKNCISQRFYRFSIRFHNKTMT